jgi:hypothetical protein
LLGLEEEIADEEDARRPAEELGRKAHLPVHGERGETDVHTIEIGDEEARHEQRHKPPAHLGDHTRAIYSIGPQGPDERVGHLRQRNSKPSF